MRWPAVLSRLFSLLCAAGFVFLLAHYPLNASWLSAILLVYPLLLLLRVHWWLLCLPALLPVLDLAPHTGWFFCEEVDLLLLATAAVCYWHGPPQEGPAPLPRLGLGFRVGLCLFLGALASGIWRGIQPLPPVDANAFTNYLSPYNALRVAKGWLWPLILLPPLRWTLGPRLQGLQRYLIPGMMAGLALVCLAEIRERMLFPGLLNFSADYRATAPFSAMHTGGAALDGYLALTIPLVALCLQQRQGLVRSSLGLALLACAAYAALSTFSRGLYLGLALAGALFFLAQRCYLAWTHWVLLASIAVGTELIFARIGYRGLLAAGLLTALAMGIATVARRLSLRAAFVRMGVLIALSIAVPFAHSEYSAQRFASSTSDLRDRLGHWRHVLAVMEDSLPTRLLGMGLGTFPSAYYWHNPRQEQPASYRYLDEEHNRYLLLLPPSYPAGYGELLRMLQRVDVLPGHLYQLSFDIRTTAPQAFLHVSLCERLLLYPRGCVQAPLNLLPVTPAWHRYRFDVSAGLLGTSDGLWTPPVQLEVAAEGERSAVAIDNVSLLDQSTGHELIQNGAFTEANNYWFFSSDHYHLPWHIKNLPLNVYFELGLPGVLGLSLLLLSTLNRLLPLARRGQAFALCCLASLVAFLTVGMFDSLVDVPRITVLFLLVLISANLHAEPTP